VRWREKRRYRTSPPSHSSIHFTEQFRQSFFVCLGAPPSLDPKPLERVFDVKRPAVHIALSLLILRTVCRQMVWDKFDI
jgi:hypothetical protein